MRRFLKGLTRVTLRRNFIHMLYEGLGAPFRAAEALFICVAEACPQLICNFVITLLGSEVSALPASRRGTALRAENNCGVVKVTGTG